MRRYGRGSAAATAAVAVMGAGWATGCRTGETPPPATDGTLPACGDGVVDEGEGCDPPGGPCLPECRLLSYACGNSAIDPGERCDDGNAATGDGCAPDCTLEPPLCGNGFETPDEECDDGNVAAGDGCGTDCTVEPGWCGPATPIACGDSIAADSNDGTAYVDVWGCYPDAQWIGSERRFDLTLSQAIAVTIDLAPTGPDLDLWVLPDSGAGCAPSLSCAWSDPSLLISGGSGLDPEHLEFLAAPGTYYVIVDTYSGPGGPFILSVACQ